MGVKVLSGYKVVKSNILINIAGLSLYRFLEGNFEFDPTGIDKIAPLTVVNTTTLMPPIK